MVRDDDLLTDELTEALGKAAEPLSASTRAQIRTRVMHEVLADRRGGLLMLASHRVAAAATALAVLGSGVAYATEHSLPGDPLYGVKIAAENAAVSILPPGRLENRLLVSIAARRAGETASLARKGSEPQLVDDSLGALREAVRQATPAEGTLGEEEAHRIRERGADAPVQTREAIDEAVSAPVMQHAPEGSGGSNNRPEPDGTGGSPDDGLGYREPAQQDTSASANPDGSCETSGTSGLR
ncbi:MAG: hypothetical protein JW733_03105 [Coriobacteriia bacterium]|nr:hypothetical protein [Coriobacteriia bacterium]MBN2839374.1 hypothetical protein [Coriobacteriia bacterium]